jgi:pimeloyl-ACP methyl ester carboxylesterase
VAGRWHTIDAGGRPLRVYEDGDPDGAMVLLHHGTPGAGRIHPPWAEDAAARGLRLVTYDRPGYGESARDPGRTVASAAADAAAIADALGAERFATWGTSGGGPHALACSALLGKRVVACATLASVAPRVDGIDFLAGMGEDNVREFEAAYAGEAELRAQLAGLQSGDQVVELESLFSPVDMAVMNGPVGAFLIATIEDGTKPGLDGWIDDDLAFVAPWGFDPGDISVPVQVWQGRQDWMVPYAHGVWLARRLPRVDVRMSPDDGHVTLLERRVSGVHAFLAERLLA